MEGIKLFLIFLTVFLLRNGAISQGPTSPPGDLCASEAKLERKQILIQLQELKLYLKSQFGSISTLDKRLKNIERLLTTTEERTNKQMDELGKMIKDISHKNPRDGHKIRGHWHMRTPKSGDGREIQISSCKVNLIRSVVPNLEGPLVDIQSRVKCLQKESQEERTQRKKDHLEVFAHLEQLHTAVDPSSSYLHYSKYENSLAKRKDNLEKLLKGPKATFFTGENLTGDAFNYDWRNTTWQGGCHRLGGIKSMRVSESCVRVFKGEHCHSISRAMYPKPNSGSFINFLTPELSSVEAVGPCLPNEFQFSSVSLIGSRIALTKDKSNVRQVPDFVDFYGYNSFYSKSTLINSYTNPVRHYYMDKGRPKWINAWISKRHLKRNTGSTSGLNMAIPPELGGPTNEAYNTFNQTQNNFEEWKRITDQEIVAAHKQQSSTEWVEVAITFVYDTTSASDPYGFYYRIRIVDKTYLYGFIEN